MATEPKQLACFIRSRATFDEDIDTRCPHCKALLMAGSKWFDHAWTLSCEIARHLGLGTVIAGKIEDILEDCEGTTQVSDAAMCLEAAKAICKMLYE